MERFSLRKATTRTRHGDSLAQTESAKPGDWKHKLDSKLRTTKHERTPEFDNLLSIYIATDAAENAKLDLSLLICGCMKHEEVDVLCDILKYEDIKSLCIEGPLNERGWKTLVKAMPDSLPVKELTLSGVVISASKFELLVHVLSAMHEVETVCFDGVMVKRSLFFNQSNCPPFSSIKNLKVSGHSNPELGVYPLFRKFLEACQVEHVSIEVSGSISVREHSKLAKLLLEQTRMNSLRLSIEYCGLPEVFECYLPYLCGKTPSPLVELDLRGCWIQIPILNQLVATLPQNQPKLESLFLSNCSVGGGSGAGSVDLLPLADMNSLTHLDLSNNQLPMLATVGLLKKLSQTPNRLVILNLSGNSFGKQTFTAMASFLRDNRTLRRLLFLPSALQKHLGDTEEVLEELVQAVKHNKCLLELELLWYRLPDEHRQSVEAYLDRNRDDLEASQQAFINAAMLTAERFVLPVLLAKDLRYPLDMTQHIIGQGLTEHDALTLSSLNKQARAAHEEFLRKTGS